MFLPCLFIEAEQGDDKVLGQGGLYQFSVT